MKQCAAVLKGKEIHYASLQDLQTVRSTRTVRPLDNFFHGIEFMEFFKEKEKLTSVQSASKVVEEKKEQIRELLNVWQNPQSTAEVKNAAREGIRSLMSDATQAIAEPKRTVILDSKLKNELNRIYGSIDQLLKERLGEAEHTLMNLENRQDIAKQNIRYLLGVFNNSKNNLELRNDALKAIEEEQHALDDALAQLEKLGAANPQLATKSGEVSSAIKELKDSITVPQGDARVVFDAEVKVFYLKRRLGMHENTIRNASTAIAAGKSGSHISDLNKGHEYLSGVIQELKEIGEQHPDMLKLEIDGLLNEAAQIKTKYPPISPG
jgi:hypothetical protein